MTAATADAKPVAADDPGRDRVVILDGGMGQELVKRAAATTNPLWGTHVLMTRPELVREVHDEYFAAGAEIATANTYAILRDRLAPAGLEDRFEDLHVLACRIAAEARDAAGGGLVAGALGPLIQSYRPDLAPPPEAAAELYAEIARIQAPLVDFFIIETMSSVDQAAGALMGARSAGKPVWLSISVDDDDGGKLRSGEAVEEILPLVRAERPAALLVNCSTPEAVTRALSRLGDAGTPLGAYANGFERIAPAFLKSRPTVDALWARHDLSPAAYADFAEGWAASGARIIGGCCEVGPAHIAELTQRFRP